MRSLAIMAATALVGSALVTGPTTGAAPGSYVVRSPGAFPRWELSAQTPLAAIDRLDCSAPFESVPPNVSPHVSFHQDVAAPQGARVWRVDDVAVEAGSAVGPSLFESTADSLTVATADFNPTTSMSGVAAVLVVDPQTLQAWVGAATLPAVDPGWTTVSSADLVYQWRAFDLSQSTYSGGVVATKTYQAFLQPQSWSGYAQFAFAYGCGANSSFRTDLWTVGTPGVSGSMTSYDLEGPATRVDISGSASSVTAGQSLRLTGMLADVDDLEATPGSLELQAMPYGADVYSPVLTDDSDPEAGPAVGKVRPKVATTYRWVHASSDCCEASTSEPFSVEVRTAVTATLADATIKQGRPIKLAGRTTPAKPGATVTLFRRTAHGDKLLSHGKVGSDGRYRVSAKASKKGTWKVFVVVAPGSGNLAGSSPVRSAKVS